MPTNSATRLMAVIGWPVSHSLSPRMQSAAIEAAGLDIVYVALAVRPEGLAHAVAGFREIGLAGINVTVPHKEAVVALLDELTPEAEQAGAVNTIRLTPERRLLGHNTDGDAILDAIRENWGGAVKGKPVLVLGAGGAARAAAFAAARHGAGMVTIMNRTRERAERLASAIRRAYPAVAVRVQDAGTRPAPETAFVFQMSSGGMKDNPLQFPVNPAHLSERAIVVDAVYSPSGTSEFLDSCAQSGLRTVDGRQMLVAQGARAFQFFTGLVADRQAMLSAILPSNT